MKLSVKDVPGQIRDAFPEYKGRKWNVKITDTVSFYDTYWSGGTKNDYRAVSLRNGEVADPLSGAFGMWYAPKEPKVKLPYGVVVVEHSFFQGKDVGITIHVRRDDLAMALPSASKNILMAGGKRRHATPTTRGTPSRLGALVSDINRLVR